jgi:hypothetical protein
MMTDLGPTAEQIEAMRRTVMEQVEKRPISGERHRRPRPVKALPVKALPVNARRVKARRVGLVALGAGLVAAALVVTSVIMPGGTKVGTPANAAEFLNTAAVTTLQTSDPVPGPGQYLKISTTAQYLVTSSGSLESTTSKAWLAPSTTDVYIPADRSAQWVRERHTSPPTTFFGDSQELAMRDFKQSLRNPQGAGITRAKGGAFDGQVLAPGQKVVAQEYDVEKLPRDPKALHDYFYNSYSGGSLSVDENVWKRMTDVLHTGGIPADLRAALYKAMALVPGVVIIDSAASLNGHSGVALGRTDPARPSINLEVIIDPSTGLLIGERTISVLKDGAIPAGTTIGWTSVESSVVDNAP